MSSLDSCGISPVLPLCPSQTPPIPSVCFPSSLSASVPQLYFIGDFATPTSAPCKRTTSSPTPSFDILIHLFSLHGTFTHRLPICLTTPAPHSSTLTICHHLTPPPSLASSCKE
mmetsp:Transcript_569/g.1270  ORF Transcript_569/g.1270 Transcript_569/m.1270 type:complete len:114 (-) Transcript_569:5321-5662(-)